MRRNGSPRRPAKGFSTLEVLISASLLVGVMIGLAGALPTSARNVHRGGQSTKAAALAQQLLEGIHNDPFSQLALYNGKNGNGVDTRTPGNCPDDAPNPPVPGSAANFMGNTNLSRWASDIALIMSTGAGITGGYGTVFAQSVATDPVTGNSVLDKITVTVNWTEAGIPRSLALVSLVSGI